MEASVLTNSEDENNVERAVTKTPHVFSSTVSMHWPKEMHDIEFAIVKGKIVSY